jgi:xylan 1,4-beta-xylosidase
VVSDHFEELGRPPSLLHGGFGLRTVGELRKPRWWALALLERLGDRRLAVSYDGDGAGSLVEAVAARGGDASEVSVVLWNLTLDQTKAAGAEPLGRRVLIEVRGLAPGSTYDLTHARVDEHHSNIASVWRELRDDGQEWPTDGQWERLREADRLDELEPRRTVTAGDDGVVVVETELPMPSMSQLVLTPA